MWAGRALRASGNPGLADQSAGPCSKLRKEEAGAWLLWPPHPGPARGKEKGGGLLRTLWGKVPGQCPPPPASSCLPTCTPAHMQDGVAGPGPRVGRKCQLLPSGAAEVPLSSQESPLGKAWLGVQLAWLWPPRPGRGVGSDLSQTREGQESP